MERYYYIVCVIRACTCGHMCFPPPSPFLPPWCSHMHGLWKWRRLKCRVVSVEGSLSLLGTCVHNWYTDTFQAKKCLRTSNTFSMKLQAAASLCCAYKVPGPPTPSLDQKPAWSWGFLKPPKSMDCIFCSSCSLKTWISLWYIPMPEKPLSHSSNVNCLCGIVSAEK